MRLDIGHIVRDSKVVSNTPEKRGLGRIREMDSFPSRFAIAAARVTSRRNPCRKRGDLDAVLQSCWVDRLSKEPLRSLPATRNKEGNTKHTR